ncbi:hypothetical protein, partial [Streptomyces sp. wa1071]|uniref:hypothetical protein n=1 Tax=Streptomyces sp. wa1071 TaxID=1828217 RepID=UPI001C54D5AA
MPARRLMGAAWPDEVGRGAQDRPRTDLRPERRDRPSPGRGTAGCGGHGWDRPGEPPALSLIHIS